MISGLPSCTEVDFCRCSDIAPCKHNVLITTRNNLQKANLWVQSHCVHLSSTVIKFIYTWKKTSLKVFCYLGGGPIKVVHMKRTLSCHQANIFESVPLLLSLCCSASARTCTDFTDDVIPPTVFKFKAYFKYTQVFASIRSYSYKQL